MIRAMATRERNAGFVSPSIPRLATLLGLGMLAGACAGNPARLPELDRRFYYNLEDPGAQAEFLDLRDEQRQAFLDKHGLWGQWTALPQEERDAVSTGTVKVGYHEFQAFMAWGPPADTQLKETKRRSVEFHTFIRCTSGPKTGRYVKSNLECDGTASEKQIAVENDVVTEIKHPD
jgi:hypothetical protein